ncbi:unnamed protein product [Rotaria sordida]|uniref:Uncharacterized protein n=1 Tax=Rotaria sordida TaxID=392033 RepID=A0A818LD91_9BILA|nr:unnamed protein product [Rotaria sordida]
MQEKTNTNEDNLLLKHFYDEDLYNNSDEYGLDITTLRYTLLQCRRQLLVWINALIDAEYAYTKVELREDFNKLKFEYDKLKNETNLLKNNFQELIDNCKFLIEQTTAILKERDGYYSEWKFNRNILTPRPDWDKCSHLITQWKNLSIGKTSEELVDVLINEIIHGNTKENNNEYFSMIINNKNELNQKNIFFEQLSIDTSSEEKFIKNRHMRRRITGLLIKEIWSNKLFDENKLETKTNIKLTDYVFDYLTKRFNNKEIAIEIGYNIKDACNRYCNNYEINLFWQILTGQIEENVYHYEIKEFARILQYLIKLCSHSSSQSLLWTIRWSDLLTALHELYPNWINERISLLIIAAEKDLKQSSKERNDYFEFLLLFTEDDEGHIGEFLMTIRQQLQLDKIDYIEKIKDLLIGYPLVSINQFKQAVQLVDPHISKNELERYVNWVFELEKILLTLNQQEISSKTNENIQLIKQLKKRDFEEIILRLERCSCFMH